MKMKFVIIACSLLISIFSVQCMDIKMITKNKKCNLSKEVINEAQIKTILNLHNNFRNDIAGKTSQPPTELPFAKNMLQMYWSDEIAIHAQAYADTCTTKASTSSERKTEKWTLSESIFTQEYDAPKPMDWLEVINKWASQITHFSTKKNVNKTDFVLPNTLEFSQMIWAKSYLIGCGFSQFKNKKNKNVNSMYVCQYAQAGNIFNKPVYAESDKSGCDCGHAKLSCNSKVGNRLCCIQGFCNKKSYYYSLDQLVLP